MKKQITFEEVNKLLNYDPTTGIFTWKVARGRSCKAGSIAGGSLHSGYLCVRILGKLYLSHRLAWLISTGSWPVGVIDHIDRDKSNNRIGNLREVSISQNSINRGIQKNNSSGFKGVSFNTSRGKWEARIRVGNIYKFLGYFSTREEASIKYEAEAISRDLNIHINNTLNRSSSPSKEKLVIPDTEYLNSRLEYNISSGELFWKVSKSGSTKSGSRAGNLTCAGYVYVVVDGKGYFSHRIIWVMHHGVQPKGVIDHINGNKSDNRINNLRDVSVTENNRNRRFSSRKDRYEAL